MNNPKKEDVSMPRGSSHCLSRLPSLSSSLISFSVALTATILKIIKEMLPPEARVSQEAQALFMDCCVGKKNVTTMLSRL